MTTNFTFKKCWPNPNKLIPWQPNGHQDSAKRLKGTIPVCPCQWANIWLHPSRAIGYTSRHHFPLAWFSRPVIWVAVSDSAFHFTRASCHRPRSDGLRAYLSARVASILHVQACRGRHGGIGPATRVREYIRWRS
jgi:hypothetical protein